VLGNFVKNSSHSKTENKVNSSNAISPGLPPVLKSSLQIYGRDAPKQIALKKSPLKQVISLSKSVKNLQSLLEPVHDVHAITLPHKQISSPFLQYALSVKEGNTPIRKGS
jgi:hypothetical protein